MPKFKIVVNDPKTRKAYQIEVEQEKSSFLIGRKIGEEFDASPLGLPNYKLKITGGTDKDGFPMIPYIEGTIKKRALLSAPPGFHPWKKGLRKRKTVRGNTISPDIVQINTKVIEYGEKSLEELIKPKSKEEKK